LNKFIDLTGKRFGKLVVIEFSHIARKRTYWLCRCDCGNTTVVVGYSLKNGDTKSCGCYHLQRTSETFKKYNKYDLSGEYGIGYSSTDGKEFYFDLEDYEKIKDYCWGTDTYGYMVNTRHGLRMNRLVMDYTGNETIDHVFGNKRDNRKINLRIASYSLNRFNTKIRSNNTTGHMGITIDWVGKKLKYLAQISINHKHKNLGRFDDIEDAIKARKEAELKYYGKYSRTKDEEIIQ
jgi:hypothetical protein